MLPMEVHCFIVLLLGFLSSTIGSTVKPKAEQHLELTVIYLKQRTEEMEGRISLLENKETGDLVDRLKHEILLAVRDTETQEMDKLLVKMEQIEMESRSRRNDISAKLQQLDKRVTEVELRCGQSTANNAENIDSQISFEMLQLKEAIERIHNVKEELTSALENQRGETHTLQVQMAELNSELHFLHLIRENMSLLSDNLNESLTLGLENIQTNLTRNMRIFENSFLDFSKDCANFSYISKLDEHLKNLENSSKNELETLQYEVYSRLEKLELKSAVWDDVSEMKKTLTNHSSQLSRLNHVETVDKVAPSFSVVLGNVSVPEGSSSVLPCDELHPNATIRWLKGEVVLAEEAPMPGLRLLSNHSLWIKKMGSHLKGFYTCIAVWSQRQVSTVVYVTMGEGGLPCDVEFWLRPSDSEFQEGVTAHLDCQAKGDLSWLKDGLALKTGDRVTVLKSGGVVVRRVRAEDAGTYTCVAEGGNGCIGMAAATLKVTPKVRIQDICGVSRVVRNLSQSEHGKIMKGGDALEGAYPWQAMLWNPGMGQYCGGSLLNKRWVVTAAHCIMDRFGKIFDWHVLRILLGKHKRARGEETEEEFRVSRRSSLVVHPEYRRSTFDNDVALIRLDRTVHFSERVLPLCLSDRTVMESLLRPGEMGVVIGWGRLRKDGGYSRHLKETPLSVVEQERCISSTTLTVTSNMFCAGYSQGVINEICAGDGGGPFQVIHMGRWNLVGVVSWGEACGQIGKYEFFTRIVNYLDWIRNIIQS